MALPRFHSCTWSDDEARSSGQPTDHEAPQESPQALVDKELYLWATYPDSKRRKEKKKVKAKKAKSRRTDLNLWAVVIVEAVKEIDAFTFEATLRKVFKREESIIKVWVRNDPRDQSDEAAVFGFVSPHPQQLNLLEQQLTEVAARRIYEAIAQTWPDPPGRPLRRQSQKSKTSSIPGGS